MIDEEFSESDPIWHRVRLVRRESYDRGINWLMPRVQMGRYTVIWGSGYWDVFVTDPDLAFEFKLRFG